MKFATRFAFAAATLAFCAVVQAQTWPTKPVKIIVPYPPGGAVDVVTRKMAAKLQEQTGQTFFVENKSGATGSKRLTALPNVPTFAEAGVKNFGLINFTGLWAPKGTPQVAIDRLQKEIATAMATQDMKAFAESIASDPTRLLSISYAVFCLKKK